MDRSRGGTFDRVLTLLSIIFLVSTLLALLYAVFDSIPNLGLIESLNTSNFLFFSFRIGSSFAYMVFALILIIPIAAIFTFFSRDRLKLGKKGNTTIEYGKYFMIFVLLELIFSEIESYINPSVSTSFPYNLPIPGENFVLSASLLSETLVQFLVLGFALVVYYTYSRSSHGFFSMNIPVRTVPLIAMLSAIPVAVLYGGGLISSLFTFISFAFLNIAFIRVGFLKGFTMNFAITMSNLIISISGPSSLYSTVFTFVLLFFAFLGITAIFMFIPKGNPSPHGKPMDPIDEITRTPVEHREYINSRENSQLFIRSTCPSCGNTTFQVMNEMNLKCARCGQEIDRDAMGEPNISLRRARGSGY